MDAQKGFSDDGYIIDQDCFAAWRYRGMRSDRNGCGWIAAYNLLRALGRERPFEQVCAEMDALFLLRLPGPTTLRVMLQYLARHAPGYALSRGRAAVRERAGESGAGILRYWEGREPHFVAFQRLRGGSFRFFNVADGLEDYTASMEEFLRGHCARGGVRAILYENMTDGKEA